MALHRFKAVTLTERNVSRSSKFDLDEFIDAGGMGFLQSGISRVHLRFFDGAASHLEETRISESQKLIHQPNGDVDLISDLPITEQLKWWIMGFGENVEVIAPVRLRTEIAKRLVAAAAHYISKG